MENKFKVNFSNDEIIITDLENFNIKQVVECGQCFRWKKVKENDYIGVAFRKVIEVIQEDDKLRILNSNEEDFNNIWKKYFDLERDYDEVKKELAKDEILSKSVEYGYGIRILNQEPFELLISFIIFSSLSIHKLSLVEYPLDLCISITFIFPFFTLFSIFS